MKLILYRDPYSEAFSFRVGHIDTISGLVYRDVYSELKGNGNCIGCVKDGYVFNNPYSKSANYRIGHYRDDGRIYREPYSESPMYCIGHVGKDGIIYNDPHSESSFHAWGHIENSIFSPEAAAAFMLLLPR